MLHLTYIYKFHRRTKFTKINK